MKVISPQFIEPKKPWYKRLFFYGLAAVVVAVSWFAFHLGVAYNTIVINNDSVWQNIKTALFDGQPVERQDPNPLPIAEPNRLDVLLLGIRGTDPKSIAEEGGLLTDTILLVSIDKVTKKVALLSIPRDLYINILGVKGKLNEAYERGLERKQGLDLVKQIVSRITGVYVDKAIVFDFNAFRHIVENLGGVEMTLARPFSEKQQWGYEFALPAGLNHLNGEQALYYVRSRYSSSDFDRARRQQAVITAIKTKLLKNGYLTNPVKITNLLADIKGDIRTDFQIWDIKDVLELAGTFNAKTPIKQYVVSTDNLLYESHNAKGEYILLPKGDSYDMIRRQFNNILQPEEK